MAFSASDPALATIRTGAELERALAERRKRPPLATGLGPLDRLAGRSSAVPALAGATGDAGLDGGGLPRGALIELRGGRSSGRLALALSALAAATHAGEPAALIDPGDQLDPDSAKASGVALERLLWVRPKTPKSALAAAEALVEAGFALVVVDLGEVAPSARRLPFAAWQRLARAARSREAVLLAVGPGPLAGTAADVVLSVEKARALWDRGAWPPLLSGLSSRLSGAHRRRLGTRSHPKEGPLGQSDTLSLSGPR